MTARRRFLPFAVLLTALAGGGVAAAPRPQPPRWTYRVHVAEDLGSLDVRLEFSRFAPRRLLLADGRPLSSIEVRPESGVRVEADPAHPDLLLAREVDGPFLSYRVDLRALAGSAAVVRAGGDLLTHACSWMLRPALVPDGLETTVVFDGAADLRVEAPWERLGLANSFRVPGTSWDFVGHVAIGRPVTRRFQAAGATVDLVRLGGPLPVPDEGLERWIGDAVRADALPYGGRFPESRLTVFLVPSPRSSQAVPFGSAWYGGGPHVVLLVGGLASERALREDWTAVHEIFHTTMPPVVREDAWFSEGFATWHQEIVRARAGIQSAEDAWSEIESGFRRGRARGGDLPLAEESRAMHANHSYHRVYWAGAAIAMLLDVDLRRSSGGTRTLDDVMRWIREIPGARGRPVTAREAIAFVDARLGEPRFARVAEPWLASREFPDVGPAKAWLGVETGPDGRAVLVADAPGSAARAGITSRPPTAAGALR